jgi:TRAP-type mannitol/chloroaromatic compound transport system permease small subunit
MQGLLRASDAIDSLLRVVGKAGAWLFVVTMIVICFDVVTRKIGYQIPGFGSTKLQELEWHLHTALFSAWLGLCYVYNAHVRIDVFTGNLAPRTHAWIELVGCLVFAIPYCLVVVYYGYLFANLSYLQNEFSDAPTGLPYRWIIKGILFIGTVLLIAAVFSVMFRRIAFLFGDSETAARALPARAAA